ncbi:MAG: hypothetical protein ACXWZF_12060 [Actinomycetota bacterium]
MSSSANIPPALRDDLLTFLFCTSPDRARIIAELLVRNPGIGDLLATSKPTTTCGRGSR